MLAAVLFAGGFLFIASAYSQEECATSSGWSSVKINEISSYSSSNDWVELYNLLDMCVRLDGLKLWDSSVSSAMRVLTGDIFAQGFLVVNVNNRLGRDADSVILKADDLELDRFDYGTTEFPTALENEVWAREIDGLGDWKITIADTPGFSNIIQLPTSSPPIDPPTSTPPVDPPTTTPPVDPPTTTPPIDPPTSTPPTTTVPINWMMIKINEFVSNPTTGNEWVELYNLSDQDVDLFGAKICDNRETACKNLSGSILSHDWFLFDLLTTSFLNNDGDSVILKDPESNTIDRFDYDANSAPQKGQALARKIDGTGELALTIELTPGAANVITAPMPASARGGSAQTQIVVVEEPQIEIDCQEFGLFINELYPNPPGSDTNDEFIEIINLSSSTINLDGWKLADLAQSFKLSGQINSGQILFWNRSETKIALNNTTKETVKLISPAKCEADFVSYDKADEGESYSRAESGEFAWTSRATPGEKNIFSQKDSGIIWKISFTPHAVAGETIVFDAEDSADERGGEIFFEWDFGNNATTSGAIVSRTFLRPGEYQVTVFASSTSGSKGKKIIDVSVSAVMSDNYSDVIISEIFANPSGADEKEFIEIFNSGVREVDLSGWMLRASSGNPFAMPAETKIGPNKYLAFFKKATKISINNSEDKVSLIDHENRLIDMVRIGKSKTDESYSFMNGEWKWNVATPGAANNSAVAVLTASSASGKKITSYPLVAIETARQMDKDDGVKTRGVVTVLPQMFGKQYFYIFDGKSGIQIYQYQGKFPALKFGDLIEVKGVLSEASGVKRIKLKDASAVDILAIEQNILPMAVEIGGLSEDYLGALIKVQGEITSKKSNYIYIDDGHGEIKIYFKQNAKIDKSILNIGEQVGVVGVLEISAGEMTIMPRQTKDIDLLDESATIVPFENKETGAEKSAKEIAEKYLTVTAGGLTAFILGFLGRARGLLVLGAIKRIALKIITRV